MNTQPTQSRRIGALLSQLVPATAASPESASRRFPGCASVLDVQPCSAAEPADQHAPVAASLQHDGTRLAGKVALITGAGSGIGRASAILFARQGASVFLVDLHEEGLAETARLIAAASPSAASRTATQAQDISAPDANARLVSACVSRFGDLHIFFANAGVLGSLGFAHTSPADFMSTLQVNVVAVHAGFVAAAEHMQSRGHGGSLLATSSVAGLRAGAGGADYSASKAAVVSLVRSAACELAGTGIRANAINPGLIETGMTEVIFAAARARHSSNKIGQLNPLRRPGSPHEVAALALFLASDESSYVNGQAVVVDGGLSSSHPFLPGRGSGQAPSRTATQAK